jgi:hypothetical protein
MNLILSNGYPFPYPDGLSEAQQQEISQAAPSYRLVVAGVTHFEQKYTTTVQFRDTDTYHTALAVTGWEPWSPLVLEAPTSAADGYDYPAIIVGNVAYCGYQLVEHKEPVLPAANPLDTPETRKVIADALRDGVAADIWYDAGHYGDNAKATQIEETQNAMDNAAQLLDPS